jgi:hypothetical protein
MYTKQAFRGKCYIVSYEIKGNSMKGKGQIFKEDSDSCLNHLD